MTKKAQVTLRLPLTVIERVRRVAKIAEVTPTQVYVVLLAYQMEVNRELASSQPQMGKE